MDYIIIGGTEQALLEESMRWNELSEENCSMARTISVIGDRWTLLILRDCFLRVRRFEDFQERLGITRPILANRLKKLVDEFVLVKVPYQQRPRRLSSRISNVLSICTRSSSASVRRSRAGRSTPANSVTSNRTTLAAVQRSA